MTSVKGDDGELLVPELMAQLFARIMREGPLGGTPLRPSQIRVLSQLDDRDRAITELAERVGMTKQGCGQFVRKLAALGLVEITPDTSDRRVRLVSLTADGRRQLGAARRALFAVEEAWAGEVGRRRFATFREVLHELGGDPSD